MIAICGASGDGACVMPQPVPGLLDQRRITRRGVADEDRAAIREVRPPRSSSACGFAAAGVSSVAPGSPIDQGGEHIAALRIHPRDEHVGVARRRLCSASASSADTPITGLFKRHRQALNRGQADAKAGERAGAGRDGEQIDPIARDAGLIERARDFAGQALAVRARLIARQQREHAVVVRDGHAAAASRRIESQNDHGARCVRVLSSASIVYSYPFLRPCPSLTSPLIAAAPANLTPAMKQYFDAKRQYRHALLFFRMGDFYEMFYEDALVASRALDLTLTSRSKDSSGTAVPMCGVPFHAADGYIARLVKKGYRVAICEQIENPKKAKGVVKRDVVRVVSPGTLTDAAYLDAREPAFLMAIVATRRCHGLAAGAITAWRSWICRPASSTSPNTAGPEGLAALRAEIAVLRPREIVVAAGYDVAAAIPEIAQIGAPVTEIDGWHFELESARQTLLDQLRVQSLEGFGLERRQAAVCAGGALVRHLRDTQKAELAHVRSVRLRQLADGLLIDPTTLKHLEIVQAMDGGRSGSLLDEIDRTVTPMGCRLLRTWLLRPLTALEPIRDRLDAVEELAVKTTERGKARETLKSIQDLERLISRIALVDRRARAT